jgi:hypothetical protein
LNDTIDLFEELKLTPKWHDYTLWEDYINGMYNSRKDENIIKENLILFRADTLYDSMLNTLRKYKHSTEVNLTNTHSKNQKSWVGQIVCNSINNSTIQETTIAWFMLSDTERDYANECADKAIKRWIDEKLFG